MNLPVKTFDVSSFSGLIGFPSNFFEPFQSSPKNAFIGLTCYNNKVFLACFENNTINIYNFPLDVTGFEALLPFIKAFQNFNVYEEVFGCTDMEFIEFWNNCAEKSKIDWVKQGFSRDTSLKMDLVHLNKTIVESYYSVASDMPATEIGITKLLCGIAADPITYKFLVSRNFPPSLQDLFMILVRNQTRHYVGVEPNETYGYKKTKDTKMEKFKKKPQDLSLDHKILLERFSHLPLDVSNRFAFMGICKEYNIFFGYCSI